jgi:hypothetical protein
MAAPLETQTEQNMNSHSIQIGASIALCVVGLVLLALPELGHSLVPIETASDRNFAVRLLGVGLVCAVFLAWSIKDFIET